MNKKIDPTSNPKKEAINTYNSEIYIGLPPIKESELKFTPIYSNIGFSPIITAIDSNGTANTVISIEKKIKEDTEKVELLKEIESLSNELQNYKKMSAEYKSLLSELTKLFEKLIANEKIKNLQGKIAQDAEMKLREDQEFLNDFQDGKTHEAYVVSMDIRASTELMLNAKKPELFANFITELCSKLTALIIDNGGIFDKFTGDGVLAFFPTFYSGDDSGYRAITAADQAIRFFKDHYRAHRNSFNIVITNTGLGVGIDYGPVHFVTIGESLSVVGPAVVYACRFSSTEAGTICINQPAKESLEKKYQAHTIIEETILSIKSGSVCAYKIYLNKNHISPVELPWRQKSLSDSTTTSEQEPTQ